MNVYIDLFTTYTNPGYMIHGIGRSGSINQLGQHLPWFMVFVRKENVNELWRVLNKLIKNKIVVDYTEYKSEEVVGLVLKRFRYEPDQNLIPVEIRCRRKEYVPTTAELIKKSVNNVYVGEYNIVYPVRVSFDFDVKYFHKKCPLLFVQNSELESVSLELIEMYKDFKILSFDIEVYTTSGRFPVPGDPILSLQYAVTTLGNPDVSDPAWIKDSVQTIVANKADWEESEDIAEKFLDVLMKERPDVIVGYNSVSFDLKYLKPFLGMRKNSIVSDFYHMNLVDYVFPHIDLLLIRKSMGSSLGVRSQVSQSLDDVVKEVVRGTKFEWLLDSKLMEAEMKLDHTKIVNEWEKRSELFYNYITADAYLTLVLAYMWMYTLIFLSSLVQIPLTQLSKLNLGQVSEYNFVHWLEKLGFRVMTAERRKEFRKISGFGFFDKYLDNSIKNLFTKGKVYVKNYGVFENVVEGDFAQLYPSLMSNDTIDPTAIRVSFYVSKDETEPIEFSDPLLRLGNVIGNKTFPVVLGYKSKRSADTMVPHDVIEVVPTYGPIAFLIYKMFTMRKITKKLKKRAEVEGRAELMSVDQAVKILNNASYGAFSKRRGFINPVLSSYVFWKTLKIFYDVIDFVESLGVTVLYGDTDSIFVKCKEDEAIRMFPDVSVREACWRWFTEHIVPQVNKYVKSRYGKELELSPKDIFDVCVYPKSKYSNAPSKKSYICVNKDGDSFKVEVVKGDFFKAMAPDGIKDNMSEFYAEILKNKPKTQEEVIEIAKKLLSELPPHKYFMKKTIDTFESEVLPDTEKTYEFKLKKLNKTFHYAALHILFIQNEKIPEVRESKAIQILSDIVRSNGKSRFVVYMIDAERLLKEKGNVTIYFIPSDTPNKFIVFVDYDEKRDVVIVHGVNIKKVDIVTEKTEGGLVKDVAYRVEETYVEMEIPRTKILIDALNSVRKYIIDDVSRKLLPALHSTQFNGFVVQSIDEEDEDEEEDEE